MTDAKAKAKARRTLSRAERAAREAAAAIEAERRAEAIAPAVQRRPVTVKRLTEDGKQITAVLRGPRLMVSGTRVQHASAIGVLAGRHKSHPSRIRVTPLHAIAAELFTTDFEELASGISLGASDYAGKTGSGTRDPVALAGAQADQLGDQLWRREQLRRRLTALGKLADVLIHVAVRNGSLTAWAQENRTNASVALGYLVAALEVLVALYGGQQSLVEHRRATERARRPISSAAAPAAVAEGAEQQTA